MHIRQAQFTDIPDMVSMGRQFHAQTICAIQDPWDDESFVETLKLTVNSSNSHVIVLDDGKPVGMGCIILAPRFYNKHRIVANELFCWVNPDKRGRGLGLFDTLEEWAIAKGAHTIVNARAPGIRDDAMDRYYLSRGFVKTDVFYTKVLPCHRN